MDRGGHSRRSVGVKAQPVEKCKAEPRRPNTGALASRTVAPAYDTNAGRIAPLFANGANSETPSLLQASKEVEIVQNGDRLIISKHPMAWTIDHYHSFYGVGFLIRYPVFRLRPCRQNNLVQMTIARIWQIARKDAAFLA